MMTNRIINCRWESGERYQMLVDGKSRIPIWSPTLYITSQLRNVGCSVATIEAALGAIQVLLDYAESNGIDLEQRILSRQYLAVHEVDALSDWAQRRFDLGARGRGDHRAGTVSKAHYYNRLSRIASYLEWYAQSVLGNRRTGDDDHAIARLIRSIRARRPRWRRGTSIRDRGLTDEQRHRLLELIEPGHPDNPFNDTRVAERNALVVRMLDCLGLRRGELLGVKVSDIDWQGQTVCIQRRADDAEDPRTRQPRTKTAARTLNLFPDLTECIDRYVRGARRHTNGADTHRYLFVVHGRGPYEGDPLSEAGLAKIFARLRQCNPLLVRVHPHALRHTWNWRFSKAMDGKDERPSPAAEEKARSHLMGWCPGSGTAAVYDVRHVEESAREAAQAIYETTTDRTSRGSTGA